jgi:hypothetical protein
LKKCDQNGFAHFSRREEWKLQEAADRNCDRGNCEPSGGGGSGVEFRTGKHLDGSTIETKNKSSDTKAAGDSDKTDLDVFAAEGSQFALDEHPLECGIK